MINQGPTRRYPSSSFALEDKNIYAIHVLIPETAEGFNDKNKEIGQFCVVYETGSIPDARVYSSSLEEKFYNEVRMAGCGGKVSYHKIKEGQTTIILSADARGEIIAPWGARIGYNKNGEKEIVLVRLSLEYQKRYVQRYLAGVKLAEKCGADEPMTGHVKYVMVPNHVKDKKIENNGDGRVVLGGF